MLSTLTFLKDRLWLKQILKLQILKFIIKHNYLI